MFTVNKFVYWYFINTYILLNSCTKRLFLFLWMVFLFLLSLSLSRSRSICISFVFFLLLLLNLNVYVLCVLCVYVRVKERQRVQRVQRMRESKKGSHEIQSNWRGGKKSSSVEQWRHQPRIPQMPRISANHTQHMRQNVLPM